MFHPFFLFTSFFKPFFWLEKLFTHPSKSTALIHLSKTLGATFASNDAGNAINDKNGIINLFNVAAINYLNSSF